MMYWDNISEVENEHSSDGLSLKDSKTYIYDALICFRHIKMKCSLRDVIDTVMLLLVLISVR